MPFDAYLAADRAAALALQLELPEEDAGAALTADISGFTPLTDLLARELGPRHGAEELARLINDVYEALIAIIHRHGGAAVAFSGDAVTCWFSQGSDAGSGGLAGAALRALRCAFELQAAMTARATVSTPRGSRITLALKVAIVAGPIRRMLVGDPAIQRIDVLAGATMLRLAAAEQRASPGEVVVDRGTAELLGGAVAVAEWRRGEGDGAQAAVVAGLAPEAAAEAAQVREGEPPELALEAVRPLLLPALAERLASGYGDPPTELRPVVALFLRFSSFDYDHDPEAGPRLDAYVRRVQAVVARYGGALVQLTIGEKGSYLYAAFGALVAHENDPERALRAALELQAAPPELAFAGEAQIGITRGTMRTGTYGGSARRTYGVLGDAVNMAARLMQAAPAGHILAEAAVRQDCAPLFRWQQLPPLKVKGKAEPLTAFRLLGAQAERAAAFYQGPLVGRDAEVGRLLEAARPLLAGQFAGVCAVVGEAGIGKSRLVYEARTRLADQTPLTWMYCPCDEVLRGALRPFATFLRGYFRQTLEGDEAEHKARFATTLDELIGALSDGGLRGPRAEEARAFAAELNRRRSFLGALVGLHWEGSAYEQLDPKPRFETTLSALVTLVRAESLRRPVWLELEDAHWLDDESRLLVAQLSRALAGFPAIIVCAARPDDTGGPIRLPVAEGAPYATVDLGSLTPPALRSLAAQVVDGPIDDELTRFVYDRTGGNPFFAEQLLLDLRERGKLQPALAPASGARAVSGGWTMRTEGAAVLDVPDTLNRLLVARLDRLVEPVREVVQAAAVLGREWELPVLASMQGDGENLSPKVDTAAAGRVWSPLSSREYLFRHVLLRDAAYGMQPRARLRALHLKAAQAIEQEYAENLISQYGALVHHYREAEEPARERQYALLAGQAAAARFGNAEAIAFLSRAIELTADDDLEGRWEVLRERERVYRRAGRPEEREADLALMTRIAGLLDDNRLRADAARRRVDHWQRLGRAAEAAGAIEETLHYSRLSGWYKPALTAYTELAWRFLEQGRYDEARAQAAVAIEVARSIGLRQAEGVAINTLGNIALAEGDFAAAHRYYTESVQIDHELGNRDDEAIMLGNFAELAWAQGDYEAARELCERGVSLAREVGNGYGEAWTLTGLAYVALQTGDAAQAERLSRGALLIAQEIGEREREVTAQAVLAPALAALGRGHEAEATYRQALAIREELEQPPKAADLLAGLARLALARGDAAGALGYVETILGQVRERGSFNGADEPFLVALTCYEALRTAGDPRAPALLERAHGDLQARAAGLPDAARRSYLEAVPHHLALVRAWREASQQP